MKLQRVLSKITDEEVMLSFLKDVTTPSEFNAMQERLEIAVLLSKNISYNEISKQTGASTTTITRVSRFLRQENYGGYRHIIKNIDEFL